MIAIDSGIVFTGFLITSGNTEHSPCVLNVAPECVLGIKSFHYLKFTLEGVRRILPSL